MLDRAPLTVRHRGWARPLHRPAMANEVDVADRLSLTDRFVERDGRPWIPVSGEIHYSRLPRHRWDERIRLAASGGVTVVNTYVPWLHHAPAPGPARFDDNLDVAGFVDACERAGLHVVLRIGPWVHAELRHGGFPGWVQEAPVQHRTDDPSYLALVEQWFGQLGAHLAGRARPGGPVLAIQLENELYDQPDHLRTLKRLARGAGMSAPLWCATAWGGAQLPPDEVLGLYSGYGDGFWVDADGGWQPSFRAHYHFSHDWDDPGVGADVRARLGTGATTAGDTGGFPPATCELGGGMATAYHRRPRLDARDVAAVGHTKIGNGSAWQGYYMFAGGSNRVVPDGPDRGGTQESQATGYPNDVPRLSYDFAAPVGQAGTLAPSHALLRVQHAFLASFGEMLAPMTSSLPDHLPDGVQDDRTLRWALRSDGTSGFVLLAWHQPYEPLDTFRGARLTLTLADEEVTLPSHPVDVPHGTLARWPVNLDVGGVRLRWLTASVVTVLPGEVPMLVALADAGIDVEAATSDGVRTVSPGLEPVRLSDGGAIDLLVLPADLADQVWVRDGPHGRTLLLTDADLAWAADGPVLVRASAPATVRHWSPADRAWRRHEIAGPGPGPQDVPVTTLRGPGPVPVHHGFVDGRQSAPDLDAFEAGAAVHLLDVPAWAGEHDALLRIDWAGDVGELRVDGEAVDDRFWDGSTWQVSLRDVGWEPGRRVTLHLLPLSAGSRVWLPEPARRRRRDGAGDLLGLDSVRVVARGPWLALGAGQTSAPMRSAATMSR